MAYADSNLLLKVAYGALSNVPSNPADGTMFVTTDATKKVGFKLPNLDLFWVNSETANVAKQTQANLSYWVHNNTEIATGVFNGFSAQQIYIDNKYLICANNTAVTAVSADTTNPYLNLLIQTGADTYAVAGSVRVLGSGPITVKGNGTDLTISAPAYPTALQSPGHLSFATDGTGVTSSTTYNGASGVKISYNTIGAAKLQGNDIDVIDWSKNYSSAGVIKSSGGNDFKIPSKFLPKEALLDLVTVAGSADLQGETAALTATGVEAGDFVQVAYDGNLYYVNAVSNGSPTSVTQVKVGAATNANVANTTVGWLTIYNKHLSESASSVVAFNGAAKNLYIQHGLVVTSSATGVTQANTTSSNNQAFINQIFNVSNADPSASVDSSIKFAGANSIKVYATDGTIYVDYTEPAALENPASLKFQLSGTDFISYKGSSAKLLNFIPGTGMTITKNNDNNALTFTPTAYTANAPITVNDYVISHNTITGLVPPDSTYTSMGPTSAATITVTSHNDNLTHDATFTVPYAQVNAYGHVTSVANRSINLDFPITQGLTSGDLAATILGVNIYSGVTWDTF